MKKNVEEYMNNDLLASEEGAIEEKIMREGFDFMERRAAWKGIVADTFACSGLSIRRLKQTS